MNRIKKAISILLLLPICLALFSCANVGTFDINTKTVMKVNGVKISYDEYKSYYYAAAGLYFDMENTDWNDSANLEKLKAETEYLIRCDYAVRRLCDLYDIEPTKDDKEYLDDLIQYYMDLQGSEEAYRKWLAEERMTGTVFRSMTELTEIYEPYLAELLFTGYGDIIKMDKNTVIEDVKANFYRYTQIFIKLDEKDIKSENLAKIEEALAKINSGADFYEVAKEYSEWGTDAALGEYSTAGKTLFEVEKAANELEIGEISGIVETDKGYHIVMRLALDNDYIEANSDDFTLDSASRRYNEYLDKTALELEIEYTDYGSSLEFSALMSKEE